jgi:hypothetical protein
VILAPEPLQLSDEDLPRPRLPQPVLTPPPAEFAEVPPLADENGEVADVPEDALATDRAVAEALSPDADLPDLAEGTDADILALADEIAEGVPALSGAGLPPEETLDAETEPEADIAAPVARNDDQGIARSPRPPARPSRLATAIAPTNVAPTSSDAAPEVAAESLPAGTRLVQLGAFDSAETAREQWEKIGGTFSDYFRGKSRVVQRAQSGGKTFYRLRAMGFEDLADARRFCSALLAKSADCIPVVVR